MLDPWLFPLTQEIFDKPIDVPVLILANEDFVANEDIYILNRDFDQKHKIEYIIWKGASHLHQTDLGYVLGNLLGTVSNAKDSELLLHLNYDAMDRFLKGEKVEGTYGDR